jgi:hypothetical protein
MASQQSQSQLEQSQRIQVDMEPHGLAKLVKIRIEHYDPRLGWYTSGSLSLPVHQLPLLEQAIAEMRACASSEASPGENIIPFPLPGEQREMS